MSAAGSTIAEVLDPRDAAGAAASPIEAGVDTRRLPALYADLTKARLSGLVVFTAAAGYVMADLAAIDWLGLLWTVLGVALAAGCASALNQVIEVPRDRRMHRTRARPIPSGRMSARHGFIVAILMGYVGVGLLAVAVNLFAAALALLTILIYVLAYTPLKPRTTLNTWVGAICGALPPMIGWVAATGRLDYGAWILAALLFVWQLPHFLALAWLYREDYERGGYCMLPAVDPHGWLTARSVVVTSFVLLPTTLAAWLIGMNGIIFAVCSTALGLWMLRLGMHFARERTDAAARKAFIASIIYLPLVLSVMVLDAALLHSSAAT